MEARGVPVTVKVAPRAHQKLAEWGKAHGYSLADSAQMLFDAGFAARVGFERGVPGGDAELDAQVKLVFACAGQADTAAIAKATGVAEWRVLKILEGFRIVSREAALPAMRTASDLDARDLKLLRKLYADDVPVRAIAEQLRCTRGSLEMYVSKNRGDFPKRGPR